MGPKVLETQDALLQHLQSFEAIVHISGFGCKQQYADVESVVRDVAVALFESSYSINQRFGDGNWVACFGGDPLNMDKPDVAALVKNLQAQYNMHVVAIQADKVLKEWGGVDSHLNAVYYYPTEYMPDGTVAWGGRTDDRLLGTTRILLEVNPLSTRPLHWISAGGGDISVEELQAAYERNIAVVCIKALARHPQDPAMPYGPCVEWWNQLQDYVSVGEGEFCFRRRNLKLACERHRLLQTVPDPVWSPHAGQKKILITGGSGLLGRPLVRELSKRGFAVASISSRRFQNLHPEVQCLFARLNILNLQVDLTQEAEVVVKELSKIVEEIRPHLVMNLAADRGGAKWDGTQMKMDNEILNTAFPQKLLGICEAKHIPLFLMSTEYVWSGEGNTAEGYPPNFVDEDARILSPGKGPPYAQQKRNMEASIKASKSEVAYVIRMPVLYGPMLNPVEDGTAGSSVSNFLGARSWKHDTWQRRYPTDARDVARFLGALASKLLNTNGLEGRVYHFGAQSSVSKYAFIEMFARTMNLETEGLTPEDASERPPERRPAFDVKLDISISKKELEAVNDWQEPREMDPQVIQEVWARHFITEIMAVRCISDIKRVVTEVEEKFGAGVTKVCISGSTRLHSGGSEKLIKALARALAAYASANRDLVFLTGGMTGVQETFSEECCADNTSDLKLWRMLPVGRRTRPAGVGNELRTDLGFEQCKSAFAQVGDLYIIIDDSGEPPSEESQLALKRGAIVLPLGQKTHLPEDFLRRPTAVDEEDWSHLIGTEATLEAVSDAVVRIVAKAVEQKRSEAGAATPAAPISERPDRVKIEQSWDEDPAQGQSCFLWPFLNSLCARADTYAT